MNQFSVLRITIRNNSLKSPVPYSYEDTEMKIYTQKFIKSIMEFISMYDNNAEMFTNVF